MTGTNSMQEIRLRKAIRTIISESASADAGLRRAIQSVLLHERSVGTELAAREEAAKQEYEAAKANLDAWILVKNERDELSKSGKKSKTPLPKFPAGTGASSLGALQKELDKALVAYAKYNPDIADYQYEPPAGAEEVVEEEPPTKGKKAKPMLEWDSGAYAMKWTPWPKSVEKKSGTGFGKQKKSAEGETIRGEVMGTGPGERWLSHIFGGGVAGGSVSFDVKLPDGSKCEVKELGSSSALVRPGTHGMAAYEKARDRLAEVMSQMKSFATAIEEAETDSGFTSMLKPIEQKIISFTKNFIDEEYDMMVSKGEISNDRLATFRKALIALQKLKAYHTNADVIKPAVTLNKKTVKVSQPAFVDIAKTIKRDVPDSDVLSDFETWEVVLGALKDSAFVDPTKFLDEWSSLVDPEEVFKDTDGLFIVNETKGFYWIPKSEIKSALRFEVVSQGKPKFRFLNF